MSIRSASLFVFVTLLVVGALLSFTAWSFPSNYPKETTVNIPKGATLSSAGQILADHNIIRSPFWFKVFTYVLKSRGGIVAGDYYFDSPQNLGVVVDRLRQAKHDIVSTRVTVPEGWTNEQIIEELTIHFSFFDAQSFRNEARQGYLFPDTYFFFSNISSQDVIEQMTNTFEEKTAILQKNAQELGRNWDEVVTMASILEKEVQTIEDMKLVSGILWERMSIGMPLQVDAAPVTYEVQGLPDSPISNPGLQALEAVLYPTESEYLYYLSDLAGKIYYAETFEGHQVNRELYLGR